jgi:hypothetical protein
MPIPISVVVAQAVASSNANQPTVPPLPDRQDVKVTFPRCHDSRNDAAGHHKATLQ